MLIPGRPVPHLSLTLATGDPFRLHDELTNHAYVVVEVYRGTHCSICAAYLRDLDGHCDALAVHGASVIAISMNDRATALEAVETWKLQRLRLAYGLDVATAREWGLYLSRRIKDAEPPIFSEPATFVVRSDGTLYAADVRSSPHLRPQLDRLVTLVRRAEEGYPPRGSL